MTDKEQYQAILEKIAAEGDEDTFEYKGFKCGILRHTSMKHLCGYVFLGSSKVDTDHLKVHGGMTFEAEIGKNKFSESSHEIFRNLFSEEEGWIIGFDCAHYMDMTPALVAARGMYNPHEEVYRDMDFVRSELRDLVDQITLLKTGTDE